MVVGVVVGRGSAGLHEHLGVVDGGAGVQLHVNPLSDVVVQRVGVGTDHGSELTVRVELELVGEGAEALLPHRHVLPVRREAQGHVPTFGVLAVEAGFHQVLPGDQLVGGVVQCGDLVFENEVIVVFLRSEEVFVKSVKETEKGGGLVPDETCLPRSEYHKR